MPFQQGTATSTFDLMDKLTTFMQTVPGWQLWSNIDGYSGYDFVYRSLGSYGKNDIHIRQRLGPVEPFIGNGYQYDYGGGDTGFLAFQSYVYFPQDGDAYQGVGEIGNLGPRFYWVPGTDYWYMMKQDILSQQVGGSPHIIYGDPINEQEPDRRQVDWRGYVRRRFTLMNGIPSSGSIYVNDHKPHAFDGKRYVYFADIAAARIRRYSLQRGGGDYDRDGNVNRYGIEYNPAWTAIYITYYEDHRNRTQHLFVASSDKDDTALINLHTGAVTQINGPEWPRRWGSTGLFTSGWYYDNQNSNACCWDGGHRIYMTRGGYSSLDAGVSTPDWAVYDIYTDTWRVTTDPEDPEFRGLPTASPADYSFQGRSNLQFVDKRISGANHNRLYISHGYSSGDILYIDLDDETGYPIVEDPFWNYGGQMTRNGDWYPYGGLMVNAYGRMFGVPGGHRGEVNGIFERYPANFQRYFMYTDFNDLAGLSRWTAIDPCYFVQQSASDGSGTRMMISDGYPCRVRTNNDASTNYIFIGNEDRIIVATQSTVAGNSEWSMAYMGAFDSAYDPTPYAELEEDLKAGFSRKVKLKNRVGDFEKDVSYFLIDHTGVSYDNYSKIYNYTHRYPNSERVTITQVEGDTVVFSVKNDYSAGSKLAIDPLPNGLFLWEYEKMQVTNMSNRLYDDFGGSDDPSAQAYSFAIPNGEVNTAASSALANNADLPIWPYQMSSSESEGEHSSREVRGDLIGVYALGDTDPSTISEGDTVALGDDVYFVIYLPDYNKLTLIGPINS